MFIAGLQIDERLYEAGAIDGFATGGVMVSNPSGDAGLSHVWGIAITNSFAAANEITRLVGFPSTDYACHTIMQHLHDYGTIRFEMGYASSIARCSS